MLQSTIEIFLFTKFETGTVREVILRYLYSPFLGVSHSGTLFSKFKRSKAITIVSYSSVVEAGHRPT